ncbi:MAG TPA: nucleotidyltransferase domain-containing protein [Chitinophagaceae bacterium]|nr:nucleotidyltransferase domain-containing protein [Chitinophagaceae bacterium]
MRFSNNKSEIKNKVLSEIKKAVLSIDSSAEIILFGSMARGDNKDDSDWDILILTDNKVDAQIKSLFGKALLQVELDFMIGISIIIKNKKDWQNFENTDIYQNIEEDGILL